MADFAEFNIINQSSILLNAVMKMCYRISI